MNIESSFLHYQRLAGDSAAAAMLVLAEVLVDSRPPQTPLAIGEVSSRLGVSRSMVYALISQGKLVACKIGRAIRIRPSDLDDFERQVAAAGNDNLPDGAFSLSDLERLATESPARSRRRRGA
jgi:excisionase family DNA binding protein